MDQINAQQPDAGTPPNALVRAIRHLLRPLVRALIAHGITFPILSEILKRLYVEIAEIHFPLSTAQDKPVSDSRISLLTRVHRKDVKRLRGTSDDTPALADADTSLAAQLIAKWLASPDYTDAAGNPLALTRAGENNTPSFDLLVTTISKDVRPRVLLDELIDREIISQAHDNRLTLNMKAFVPQKDFDNLSFFYGHNLHDHLAASTHNLLAEGKPHLERSVYYYNLTPTSIEQLRQESESAGMDVLLKLNKKAHALAEQDTGKANATQRMTFGIYFYNEETGERHD